MIPYTHVLKPRAQVLKVKYIITGLFVFNVVSES